MGEPWWGTGWSLRRSHEDTLVMEAWLCRSQCVGHRVVAGGLARWWEGGGAGDQAAMWYSWIPDRARRVDGWFGCRSGRQRAGVGHLEGEGTVGSSPVVVAQVLAEHRFEVSAAEDQKMVQAVVSYGPHEALGEGVRPWRADGRLDGFDADRSQHRVERRGELGVSVADQEAEPPSRLFELPGEVATRPGSPMPRSGWHLRRGGAGPDARPRARRGRSSAGAGRTRR